MQPRGAAVFISETSRSCLSLLRSCIIIPLTQRRNGLSWFSPAETRGRHLRRVRESGAGVRSAIDPPSGLKGIKGRSVEPHSNHSRGPVHCRTGLSRNCSLPADAGRLGADACRPILVVADAEDLSCPFPCCVRPWVQFRRVLCLCREPPEPVRHSRA